MRTVYIVIGCDTDPDRKGFVENLPAAILSWRGMIEGIPRLKEMVRGLADTNGRHPAFTWLLRVDDQIRTIYGDYAWVLKEHRAFLSDLESDGDELGWHPHFWRRDEPARKWYQEATDLPWQLEMLRNSHAAFVEVFPGRATSVRMGWDYHNNDTYGELERLGVTMEFSAIPGLRTRPASPDRRGENFFDWYPTPLTPYHPSRADYRRPPRPGEEASSLLEVPNFTSRSRLWGLISGLQFTRKMKDPGQLFQALRRPTYWINITGIPKLFVPLVRQLRRTLRRSQDRTTVFATYFHPDELLENRSGLYRLESVKHNLEALLQVCDSEDVAVEFTRAGRVPNLLK
ncbi:MAG TPA: hypothetical protein VM118_12535 [Acidobacteriota bacterium]|nr:hypothetical protein [Acidobacteriota bacterium]